MYTDPRVVEFITQYFTPVREHVRDQADEFKRLGARYGAQWTPTILLIDSDAVERHRIEGFLPVEDFLSQLTLGLGKSAFARSQYPEAERWFRQVVDTYANTEAAAEALYWAGVSRYKATGDPKALQETATAFGSRYAGSTWAKKASVWGN